MGGKGSGATKASWAERNYRGAAAKDSSAAANRYYAELLKQTGDLFFEVWRCYPSGKKSCVGTTEDIRTDQLAVQFGGGEYELVPLRRSDNMPTGKPPLRKSLHPGRYPVLPQFERDPVEEELVQIQDRQLGGEGAPGGSSEQLRGLSPAEIYEKAKADLQQQAKLDKLIELQTITNTTLQTLAAGGGQPGGGSNVNMLRDLLALSKELTPPPVPQSNFLPQNPADMLRETVQTIKAFQTEMETFPGMNSFARALKEPTAPANSNVSALSSALSQIAMAAMPHVLQALLPLPAAPAAPALGLGPLSAPQSGPAAPAAAPAAAATATATPAAAPAVTPDSKNPPATNEQVNEMMRDLTLRLTQDQQLQLANPPTGTIQGTADWIKAQWDSPTATQAWLNLKQAALNFPEVQVVAFLGGQVPILVDTPAKKAWLESLVDLVRK